MKDALYIFTILMIAILAVITLIFTTGCGGPQHHIYDTEIVEVPVEVEVPAPTVEQPSLEESVHIIRCNKHLSILIAIGYYDLILDSDEVTLLCKRGKKAKKDDRGHNKRPGQQTAFELDHNGELLQGLFLYN